MTKKFVVLFFCFVMLFNLRSKALTGCLVSGGAFYTVFDRYGALTGTPYYKDDVITPTTFPSCPRASVGTSTGNTCTVVSGWFLGIPVSVGSGTEYNYVIFNPPVQCPVDGFVPIALTTIALMGSFYIKRKPIFWS